MHPLHEQKTIIIWAELFKTEGVYVIEGWRLVYMNRVQPVLKAHPIGHTNVVSLDTWYLVTGSVTLNCRNFCQVYLIFHDRWSLMVVVSQDSRFHCIDLLWLHRQRPSERRNR